MYAAAFVLATLVNRGDITWWAHWGDPIPPTVALNGKRATIEGALWHAFGFASSSIFRPNSEALRVLGSPDHVLVEPFYNPTDPTLVTVVRRTAPGTAKAMNSVRVQLDDPSWIWGSGATAGSASKPVEYNGINSYNQQNGVRCALDATTASQNGSISALPAYSKERTQCPHHSTGNRCDVNQNDCASDGAGNTRVSKPRVIVPPLPGSGDWLLTPSAFEDLRDRARVDKATGRSAGLPMALDLATITGWAKHGSGSGLDFGPLVSLLGPNLLPVLTES